MISRSVIKKIFMMFNALFVLTGIIFIAVGIGIVKQFDKYDQFINGQFYSLTTLFIICGILTFLITIFGYFGTFKKNYCLMLTFCGLLILLFILGITSGAIGMILSEKSYRIVDEHISDSIQNYINGDKEDQNSLDKLHQEFDCCGSNGPIDFAKLIEQKWNTTDLPFSCCKTSGKIGFANCTYVKSKRQYYDYFERNFDYETFRTEGCRFPLSYYVRSLSYALGIIAFTFAAIHFVGILLALLAAREVKKDQNIFYNS